MKKLALATLVGLCAAAASVPSYAATPGTSGSSAANNFGGTVTFDGTVKPVTVPMGVPKKGEPGAPKVVPGNPTPGGHGGTTPSGPNGPTVDQSGAYGQNLDFHFGTGTFKNLQATKFTFSIVPMNKDKSAMTAQQIAAADVSINTITWAKQGTDTVTTAADHSVTLMGTNNVKVVMKNTAFTPASAKFSYEATLEKQNDSVRVKTGTFKVASVYTVSYN